MKKLLFSLVFFHVLFVIGCQENPVTSPTDSNSSAKLKENNGPNINSGTIRLEGLLNDPYPVFNSFYIINGSIQYTHVAQILDPIPPNPQYIVYLNLDVVAGLTYLCTTCQPLSDDGPVGTVSIQSYDEIFLPYEGSVLFTKSFSIQGRSDGMKLNLRFLVTESGIELNAMWLALQGDNVVATY